MTTPRPTAPSSRFDWRAFGRFYGALLVVFGVALLFMATTAPLRAGLVVGGLGATNTCMGFLLIIEARRDA